MRIGAALPPARAHHALIYDPASRRVLLSGGSTPTDSGRSGVFFRDTWAFDGERWTLLDDTGTPLSGARLFVDRTGRVRSVGGFDGGARGVLRTWTGTSWRTDGEHEALRVAEGGAAFDARRGRIVVFGGTRNPGTFRTGTWVLERDDWRALGGDGPSPRQAHVLVYDARRDRIVLFGGVGAAPAGQMGAPLGDLWEHDGERWMRIPFTGGPAPRQAAGATYDSRRGRTVVFSGIGAAGRVTDTWAWDGARWSKLADDGPPRRAMGAMAYDAARDRVVLFGGRFAWPNDAGDTWEFDGERWREVVVRP